MPRKFIARSRSLPRISAATAALLLALLLSREAAAAGANRPGDFDYLVLSLSWSPTYCDGPEARDDVQQCGKGKRFAFVVHGLWPQYENGWPEYCESRETWVPQDEIEAMLPVMPSKRLIIHEWKKHGACLGLPMSKYFLATRLLFQKINIPARYLSPTAPVRTTPEQLVTDFVKTNRNLAANMLSVQCGNARDGARLSELRVCISRQGQFRACGQNEARQCGAKTLIMPPVREKLR